MAADNIGEGSIIFKVFLEKILKLGLYYQIFGFKVIFILMSLVQHYSVEKRDGKKDEIRLVGPSSFEIIFVLLAKAIIIQVQIPLIKVCKTKVDKPLLGFTFLGLLQQFDSGHIRLY